MRPSHSTDSDPSAPSGAGEAREAATKDSQASTSESPASSATIGLRPRTQTLVGLGDSPRNSLPSSTAAPLDEEGLPPGDDVDFNDTDEPPYDGSAPTFRPVVGPRARRFATTIMVRPKRNDGSLARWAGAGVVVGLLLVAGASAYRTWVLDVSTGQPAPLPSSPSGVSAATGPEVEPTLPTKAPTPIEALPTSMGAPTGEAASEPEAQRPSPKGLLGTGSSSADGGSSTSPHPRTPKRPLRSGRGSASPAPALSPASSPSAAPSTPKAPSPLPAAPAVPGLEDLKRDF